MTPIGGKLLCFVVLQSLVSGVFCCLCLMAHPQQDFCESEFVLKVFVEKGTIEHDYVMLGGYIIDYWTSIMAVYKGNICKLKVQDNMINIIYNECGVRYIVKNETYLIFGSATPSGQLKLRVCANHMPWSDVTPTMQNRLTKKTQYTCDCVDQLSGENDYVYANQYCYGMHGSMEKVFGRCTWKTDKSFDKCLNKFSHY